MNSKRVENFDGACAPEEVVPLFYWLLQFNHSVGLMGEWFDRMGRNAYNSDSYAVCVA